MIELKVSDRLVSKWHMLCKNNKYSNEQTIKNKIIVAVVTGKQISEYVVACFDLRFIVDNGYVLDMWRDENKELIFPPNLKFTSKMLMFNENFNILEITDDGRIKYEKYRTR